jgi:hypothetical protein
MLYWRELAATYRVLRWVGTQLHKLALAAKFHSLPVSSLVHLVGRGQGGWAVPRGERAIDGGLISWLRPGGPRGTRLLAAKQPKQST